MSDPDATGPVGPATVATNTCSECGGKGETLSGGYYVPGEQFCEPPFEEPCAACVGTGWAGVQGVVAELNSLRADRDRYRDVAQAAEAYIAHRSDAAAWLVNKDWAARESVLCSALTAAVRALASTTEQGGSDA